MTERADQFDDRDQMSGVDSPHSPAREPAEKSEDKDQTTTVEDAASQNEAGDADSLRPDRS
jgi:hypothetical protein